MKNMERKQWLDYAKCVGILLVLIGHFGMTPKNLVNLIYSFHMPLFFVISGYLFREDHRFIRAFRMLGIYILTGLFFSLTYNYVYSTVDIQQECVSLLYCNYSGGNPASILWFLLVLSGVELVYDLIFMLKSLIKKAIISDSIIVSAFIVLCIILSIIFIKNDYSFMFRIQTITVAAVFYGMGLLIKILGPNVKKSLGKSDWLSIFLVSCFMTCCVVVLNGRVDMESGVYNNYFLYIIGSMIGSVGVFSVCHLIPEGVKWMQVVGRQTLILYLGHIYIVFKYLLTVILNTADAVVVKLLAYILNYTVLILLVFDKYKMHSKTKKFGGMK